MINFHWFWEQTKSLFESEEFDHLGVTQGVTKVLVFHLEKRQLLALYVVNE